MEKIFGKSICEGIAIGKIKYLATEDSSVAKTHVEDTEREVSRYEAAKKVAVTELEQLYEEAKEKVGAKQAEIFQMHILLLEDMEYQNRVLALINEEHVNAEYAVMETRDAFVRKFSAMNNDYLCARSADVKDVSDRLIRILCGRNLVDIHTGEPVILASDDLSPSQTVRIDAEKIQALVTQSGSVYSHMAILAKIMGIPALSGIRILPQYDGKPCVVDGFQGSLILDPDEETLAYYQKQKDEYDSQKHQLLDWKEKESITGSGKHIGLYANIGRPEDIKAVLENGAEGIGLFRSEFLYLERNDFPTEEEQFLIYKEILQSMNGKPVIIRTMDIGADKKVDYFGLDKEENPALGCRAIRICLTRPDIFKTQLRALYRASAYGNLSIMYPMITSEKEVLQIKEISWSVREELQRENVELGRVKEGIMIETPAAALISDKLAAMVDFFSIGTNDLLQYTLALDRQNDKLDSFFDPHHPAILRMIRMVIENAHREGIFVGICGELGADTSLTETFIKMDIDELSVAPASILAVRKAICESE